MWTSRHGGEYFKFWCDSQVSSQEAGDKSPQRKKHFVPSLPYLMSFLFLLALRTAFSLVSPCPVCGCMCRWVTGKWWSPSPLDFRALSDALWVTEESKVKLGSLVKLACLVGENLNYECSSKSLGAYEFQVRNERRCQQGLLSCSPFILPELWGCIVCDLGPVL